MNTAERAAQAAAVTLRREGDGRYEVYVQGRRAGLVLGGAGKWTAEVGRARLGAFASRTKAVAAVAADAADPVWKRMEEVSAAMSLPLHHRSDLEIDRMIIREWAGATDFLWVLRENGTNLIPLDPDWTRREAKAVLDCFEQESRRAERPARAFVVCARSGGADVVKELSWASARARLTTPALYVMDTSQRVVSRRVGASTEPVATIHVEGYTGARSVQGQATVTVQLRPSAKLACTQPLIAAAFAYLCRYAGTLFASPRAIRVLASDGQQLDGWVAGSAA